VLDARAVDPDPLRLFERWLSDAFAAGIPNAEAMALATATPEGRPSARFVLLKGADERGFVFYTNTQSPKARELDENPQAAFVLYWVDLGRQVRVSGTVEPVTRAESEAYFRTRPPASRLAAWASSQSEVIASREALERRYAETAETYPGDDIPVPPSWGGYRLVPHEIEFWEHRDNRLHDRIRYRRVVGRDGGWLLQRLQP
jgi:pyridoxamine 5'-phosphate oxidase